MNGIPMAESDGLPVPELFLTLTRHLKVFCTQAYNETNLSIN